MTTVFTETGMGDTLVDTGALVGVKGTEILGDTYYKGIPLPRIPNDRAPGRDSPPPRTARGGSVTFAQQTFNCPQRPRDTVTTRLALYLLNP